MVTENVPPSLIEEVLAYISISDGVKKVPVSSNNPQFGPWVKPLNEVSEISR